MSAPLLVSLRRAGVGRLRWSLVLGGALAGGGCANCQLPRIDPTGEHLLIPGGPSAVAAVPAGPAPPPFAPLGGVPLSLSLSPVQVSAPIGSEVVLIASVGTQGYLLTHQRVEWTISGESAGSFVSPGVRRPLAILDWLHGLPRKVDPHYAINSTLFYPMVLDRGTPTPLDDIRVQSGQSWVSVTSPIEGTTHVTAVAPSVRAWQYRQQTASIYWVDAQWRFPAPAIANVGGRSRLSTLVWRQSSGAPLSGWQVRYEIAGGPDAGFAPDGAPSVVVVTSETGEASAEIFQKQDAAGINQINIQVIQPPALSGQSPQLTIGSGATSQTWAPGAGSITVGPPPTSVPPTTAQPTAPAGQPAAPIQSAPAAAAQLDVSVTGPTTAVVGGQARCEIQVANRGTTLATKVLVNDRFDSGLRHAGSSDPIAHDLVDIPPGSMVRLSVTLDVVGSGQQCQEIEVTAEGGAQATARHCLDVADREVQPPASPPTAPPREPQPPATDTRPASPANVSVRHAGPDRRAVGQTALFTIEVTNSGQEALEELVVDDRYESALEPVRATDGSTWLDGGGLGWKVASLGPGRTLRREVEFKCLREAPRACSRVTVSASGLQPIIEEACLEIGADQSRAVPRAAAPAANTIVVSVADTADPIKIDGLTTYQILVENKGEKSQLNVVVSVTLSDELKLDGGTGPVQGSVTSSGIRFAPIRELRSGEAPLVYEIRAKGVRAGTGQVRVEVTSEGQAAPTKAEHSTQVLP